MTELHTLYALIGLYVLLILVYLLDIYAGLQSLKKQKRKNSVKICRPQRKTIFY